MLRFLFFMIFFLSCSIICEQLPTVHFASKDFLQQTEWQKYLGDTSYITYDNDSNSDISIYNSTAVIPETKLPSLFNDGRGNGFLGNFSSFFSVNNVRMLESLLAKGYYLEAYSHNREKKCGEEYTIIGYQRDLKYFIVRTIENIEMHISYDDILQNLQYVEIQDTIDTEWIITCVNKDETIIASSNTNASTIAQATQTFISENNITLNEDILLFAQVVQKGSSPIQITGWSGENQYDQVVGFSGSKYNTLGERVITIYITDPRATGCHITRYTVGGKGDGYSDNVVSGEVYCQSTNPAAINKSGGLVQFLLRCKVRKNSPTPWWVKAQIFYRLYTPDNK